MIMKNKYIHPTENTEYAGEYFFITKEVVERRKTPIYYIFSYNTNCIGEIKWFPSWRKFCLYPYSNTVWDAKCLSDVIEFIYKANADYKEEVKNVDKEL